MKSKPVYLSIAPTINLISDLPISLAVESVAYSTISSVVSSAVNTTVCPAIKEKIHERTIFTI